MSHYADPQRCPDCRKQIVYGAPACPACGLPLQGTVAQQLFTTLSTADDLLVRLRSAQLVAAPVSIGATDLPHAPRAQPPVKRAGQGLSAATVPKILLGLGAGCVLVAALVFLAVTWSVMGVAGRTTTLVGFTVIAGTLAALMARRGLRGAAESLSLVALGLLTLDIFGGRDAGWFGDLSTPGFVMLLGGVLAVAASGGSLAARGTKATALTGSELVATLGVALLAVGVATSSWSSDSAALVLAVIVAAAVAAVLHRLKLEIAAVGALSVTAATWLILTLSSMDRADENATAQALWWDREAWPLLVAIGMVAALAFVRRPPVAARVSALAVAEALLVVLLVLPFAQSTTTEVTLAILVALIATGSLTWFVRAPWALAGALTLGLGSIWMFLVAARLAATAVERLVRAADALWDGNAGDRFPAHRIGDLPAPWLLPLAVLAVVGTVVVLAKASPVVRELVASARNQVLGLALSVAVGTATLVLFPVSIALVLALILVAATAFTGWAVLRQAALSLGVAGLFLGGAVVLSAHAEWLSAAALTTAVVLSVVVHLRWRSFDLSVIGGFLLAATTGAALWSWGAVADLEGRWVALLAILVLAALVLGGFPVSSTLRRLRFGTRAVQVRDTFAGVELAAAFTMFTLGVLGVAAATDLQRPSWAAIYLTVAGAAASTMALLREDRRDVAWLGGALLAAATWVRLWDTGVRVPEAYTLPSAVALCLVGVAHLRRNPAASTMAALGPGLALGLAPSLLWVFREPFEIRSVLLGGACLALLMVGLRIRWTAPVAYAASVGALLVLRHATPYVNAAVPRWVLIGAAGAVLIGMGVTWERRLQEARQLAGYVRQLR